MIMIIYDACKSGGLGAATKSEAVTAFALLCVVLYMELFCAFRAA
jgi:hypothetical protein